MFEVYQSVLLGLWLTLSIIIIQAVVLVRAHRRHKGYKVGVIDPALGQSSFFFRAYRTFWNSLENIVPLFGMAIIAMMAGYNPQKLSVVIWIYAVVRIIHMILYYKIATDKNPSIRSLFWATGLIANMYLMVDLGIHLLG
jgi:uncharacterized MAPEG superfamily protein|tara:strand:- start:201 stop:620 length:420 start_codon:yes stop_codon:yes gene_type:complete